MTRWTENDIPDLGGKTALVTGANSGLGLATVQALAAHGATVVLTCRGKTKADAAIAQVRARTPQAKLEVLELDLSDLASVRSAADQFKARHDRLDILVNNAGVLGLPLTRTKDGFELLFGTNHLGHFALDGLLLDRLRATAGARVVTVASIAHWTGRMPVKDLNWERRSYNKAGAYSQSKLANLMFALELQRRLDAARMDIKSIAVHPGYSATNIFFGGEAAQASLLRSLWTRVARFGAAVFAQPAELGALPSLYAATAPEASGGEYYGPNGPFEVRGYPKCAYVSPLARNERIAAELWAESERLTGVQWGL